MDTILLPRKELHALIRGKIHNLMFMGHASISYMLGNGVTENLVLILAFEFVNKVVGRVKLLHSNYFSFWNFIHGSR